jgi:hypothetical protein
MPATTQAPIPTTLTEWSRSDSYRDLLGTALRQPFMVGAFAVLRYMNAPKSLTTSDPSAGALCHQYHAGWEACLRALQDLPGFNEGAFSRIQKASELEQTGPWKWAADSPKPNSAQ